MAPIPCSSPGCEFSTPTECPDIMVHLEFMKLHTQQAHPSAPASVALRKEDTKQQETKPEDTNLEGGAAGGGGGEVSGIGRDSAGNTNHSLALPKGWEERQDANRRTYYVNHIAKITQWQHPVGNHFVAKNNTGEKKVNLRCGICEDNDEFWEDGCLEKYTTLKFCLPCYKVKDEKYCLFHADCFDKKHQIFPMELQKYHKNSAKEFSTEKLKKMSELERKLHLEQNGTLNKLSILHTTAQALTPHLATLKIAGEHALKYGSSFVDEIAFVVDAVGPGASIGLGGGLAVALGVLEISFHAQQWSNGTITSQDFKVKAIQAAVGNLSAGACGVIGALIGNAFCPGLGTVIGGIIGSIVGAASNYAARRIVEWDFDLNEDAKRADVIMEAFHFLALPAFHLINEDVVSSSFRKKVLECHPDSPRVQAKDEKGKSIAKMEWELLQHSKNVALGYFDQKQCFSKSLKDRIKDKYNPNKRDTVTFNELRDNLDKNGGISGAIQF